MIGKIFTRFEKGRITSSAQMCLRVDFILIEVPLAHRRVKVVVFVHHCIFPSLLFLKSVTLVICTVSGGNIEPGGPNEVVCKSKSLYIGPNEVVPVRRDYKCTALPFIGRTLQGSASSARARARLLLQLFAINSAPPFYRRPEL